MFHRITGSQNHGMAEVETDLWRSPSPTRLLKAGSTRTGCPVSSQIVSMLKDEDSTISLGNMFQCLILITIKKIFFMFKSNSFISVRTDCLFSCHWAPMRRVWLLVLYGPLISYLYTWMRYPLNFLFST